MRNLFSLEGQTALITGSARGIGFCLAQAFAESGAHVIINDLDECAAKAAAASLVDAEGSAEEIAFDVRDAKTAGAAIESIVAKRGALDILVNNAGVMIRKPLSEHSTEDWDSVIAVNLSAVFNMSKLAAASMMQQSRGRIINIGSVQSISSRDGIVSYVASKHGVLGLTRALASELGRNGITVNAIGPGYVMTEINSEILSKPAFIEAVEKRTPLGRWMKPEELQGTAVFLASEASAFVTGQLIMVDGGITCNTLLESP
ncbi:MAG: SDR family oxidoreductase [Hyphomicrobiales bacterium]|nr:SDR family oxidoreductase [Hyphomicrobiales bacterium]